MFMQPFWEAGAGELEFYFESGRGVSRHAAYSWSSGWWTVSGIDRPKLPEVSGLSYTEAGQSRYEERSLGSGGSSHRVTSEYRWMVTPQAAGEFTLPSITIEMKDERQKNRSPYI